MLTVLIFLVCNILSAQYAATDSTTDTWYFSIEYGGGPVTETAPVACTALTLRYHIFSLTDRMLVRGEEEGLRGYLGFLNSFYRRDDSEFYSAGFGLAYTYLVKPRFRSGWHGIGLIVEVKYMRRLFPCLGFGTSVFGNLNTSTSYAGLMISLTIGKP